jgi:tRNA-dihydrouridine synthase B
MQIGPHLLRNNLFVAPMAGVTDLPFRQLCKRLGAGVAVSEMMSSQPHLRDSVKSRRRADHAGEVEPICVQIAGADPAMLAEAARYNAGLGAQVIDINMGCPAKKVCNVLAGSALLRDEPLVGRILDAVVGAVSVPVTLKIRTGWDPQQRNAVRVARIAQSAGIRLLAVHGRTRACGFAGSAEYDTIAAVKAQVSIPVVANGDIDSPEKAHAVLVQTGADAVMIGRAAQGRPWIFREIQHFLRTGERLPPPETAEIGAHLRAHLEALHAFYGDECGVRVARKHVAWYTRQLAGSAQFRQQFNCLARADEQIAAVDRYFEQLGALAQRLTYNEEELAA